jgi:tetratricopeptide (TPR) repeat protein
LYAIGALARNYSYLGNFEEAALWYRRGAELGATDMEIDYAHLLVEGKGVARNEKEALALCEKAVSQNFPRALLPLARLYAQGAGTTRDLVEAFALAELTVAYYERTSETWMVDEARSFQLPVQTALTAEQIDQAKQRAREWKTRGRSPRGH